MIVCPFLSLLNSASEKNTVVLHDMANNKLVLQNNETTVECDQKCSLHWKYYYNQKVFLYVKLLYWPCIKHSWEQACCYRLFLYIGILRWILQKQDVIVWTGFMSQNRIQRRVLVNMALNIFGSVKGGEFDYLRGGIYSMEFI